MTINRFQVDNKWRLGPDWPGQRCCAKTRKGTACQKPPIKGKTRCRLHGGYLQAREQRKAKPRIRGRAHWAWARSRAFTEARKQIWADLRAVEARMRADGFI